MQTRVLYPIINIGMMIAFLFLAITKLPYQIGEGEMHGPVNGTVLADAEFIPPHLATATATIASPGPGPAGTTGTTGDPPSLTMIATGARFVETAQVGTSTQIATDVHGAETTPAPLLTSLVRNRPSIWGSRGFYVLLGLVYVTLLGLFIKQVVSISGGSHEQD